MIELPKYAQIKDYYCVCYFGCSDEYLVQLRLLRPNIERQFAGIRFCIGCKDDKCHLLGDDAHVLRSSQIKVRRIEFGHVSELKLAERAHPVEALLDEAGIQDRAVEIPERPVKTQRCVIIPEGNYPTMPLLAGQVEQIKRMAAKEGFEPEISNDISNAGLVIGVESVGLFEAAARGIETRLCPTGLGTRLYKSMFPNAVVQHI